ncbi:related to CTK1-carboxy-terminal domain (CTD) kinase, alpha subunit [Sporisorium reilianum SRZ2]|uniref:[RNA-polymerase]-subunit kinase n=1 Tax=Sporisorium reilianum (strain SRZ2) TaxID=999809 RepID=E6ZQ31_SPORE|nr:related to CTK1-carboxy-terminal domain (CTD) kinase, alpha subunit [Sporisorium reilianum SRZ2]
MPSDRWQPRRNPEAQHARSPPAADRDDDRSDFPNKQRRLDDRDRDRDVRRSALAARDRNDDRPGPSSPRRTDSTRDSTARPPALTIRGVATTRSTSSPAHSTPNEIEDRPRRARSPDLFDRLGRRNDDTNGSIRSRPDSTLRSRLDGAETSRASAASDTSRRGGAKLTPRGQYDDSGRRIDDGPSHSDTRDRDRNRASAARDGIPTSPRKRDGAFRRVRDRSASPTADRPRYRAADDEQGTRFREVRRNDRARTSQRSPSPATSTTGRAQWGRYDRRRSPPPRSGDRYAPEDSNATPTGPSRAARWGSRAQVSGDRDDADGATKRRRRTPSPARSEASNQSRRPDRDAEPSQRRTARDRDDEREAERDRQRDRPARWRLDNRGDDNNAADDGRQARTGRERRRSPDDRRARTPPRSDRSGEAAERGHVLSRKTGVSATFDGAQPPTGPRRQDAEANQRSVRGGGWQTLRPGSRRERDAARAGGDRDVGARNGREGGVAGDKETPRPPQTPPAEPEAAAEAAAAQAPAAIEPPRAEPGEAYESIHQVGEGTYGQVFKARSERTGAIVALKKIRMDSEKDGFPVTAMREIKLLQALRHENVVRLHEMMVTRGSVYMVFEYMEHDLNGILAHPQVQFSPAHLKSLAHQLFSGLDYLHRKAVLHRDLKGSNILLNNQGRLKLADFGLARFYAKRRLGDYTNRVVTLWYRPPELLFGETQYGSEVDMWGAGCIFLELFVKKPVFQSETELGQVQAIADILGPVTKDNWPEVDKLAWYEMVKPSSAAVADEAKDYVVAAFGKYMDEAALEVARGLLTYDPSKRWTAKQALAARYFGQEPKAELPAGLLSALEGEWHEYESRRAKKKASAHRGTDNNAATTATTATARSTDPAGTARGASGRETLDVAV